MSWRITQLAITGSGWDPELLRLELGELVLAARQLGIAEIPVMVAAGWTEAQKRAYVLADNPAGDYPASGTTRQTFGCAASSHVTARRSSISLTREAAHPAARTLGLSPIRSFPSRFPPLSAPPSLRIGSFRGYLKRSTAHIHGNPQPIPPNQARVTCRAEPVPPSFGSIRH
jgi:hypothetical protein